jgi:hypothetical protein
LSGLQLGICSVFGCSRVTDGVTCGDVHSRFARLPVRGGRVSQHRHPSQSGYIANFLCFDDRRGVEGSPEIAILYRVERWVEFTPSQRPGLLDIIRITARRPSSPSLRRHFQPRLDRAPREGCLSAVPSALGAVAHFSRSRAYTSCHRRKELHAIGCVMR